MVYINSWTNNIEKELVYFILLDYDQFGLVFRHFELFVKLFEWVYFDHTDSFYWLWEKIVLELIKFFHGNTEFTHKINCALDFKIIEDKKKIFDYQKTLFKNNFLIKYF